jgi:hypothetical protein
MSALVKALLIATWSWIQEAVCGLETHVLHYLECLFEDLGWVFATIETISRLIPRTRRPCFDVQLF